MDAKLLKKDHWYIINNGLPRAVRAKLLESPKQGRGYKNIVLMEVKGSDCGLFDEAGSVYVKDIVSVAHQNSYDFNLHIIEA